MAAMREVPPELRGWLTQNVEGLRREVGLLKSFRGPGGKAQLMRQVLESPRLLVDGLREIIGQMERLKAPALAISQARELATAAQQDVDRKPRLTEDEHRAALQLANELAGATDVDELLKRVSQRPDSEQNRKIIDFFKETQRRSGDVSTEMMSAWSWGACAFCGLLAMELGPGAAAVACLVCGALA